MAEMNRAGNRGDCKWVRFGRKQAGFETTARAKTPRSTRAATGRSKELGNGFNVQRERRRRESRQECRSHENGLGTGLSFNVRPRSGFGAGCPTEVEEGPVMKALRVRLSHGPVRCHTTARSRWHDPMSAVSRLLIEVFH